MSKTVRNCELRLAFECPVHWERLTPTEDPRMRMCGACQMLVYDCETVAELEAAHRSGFRAAVGAEDAPNPSTPARPGEESQTKTRSLDEDDQAIALSQRFGVPSINLKHFEVDLQVVKLVPRELAVKLKTLPVHRSGNSLIVAMSDPSNAEAMADLKILTGYEIEPVVAPEAAIAAAISRYYGE
jgi:hypothetical protein